MDKTIIFILLMTEHDIYFGEQLFILPNFTLLDFKSFDQAIVGLVFAHTSQNHNYDFLGFKGGFEDFQKFIHFGGEGKINHPTEFMCFAMILLQSLQPDSAYSLLLSTHSAQNSSNFKTNFLFYPVKPFLPPITKKPSCLHATSTSVKPTSSIILACLGIGFSKLYCI